ncbi:PilN domain-containing protein [Megalodesulfovibrio paquesii]
MVSAPHAQPVPGIPGGPGSLAAGSLAARGARKLGRLKGAIAGGGAGVLALVMGERYCQGVALQPHGARLRVVRFAEVEVNAPPLRVRPRIQALLARLDAPGGSLPAPLRNVVIVSPEVRGMQVDLALPPLATGKRRRGKAASPKPAVLDRLLRQAAAGELCTGLDIARESHLFSYLPLVQSPEDLFAFEDEDEQALLTVPAMAFAITRKYHDNLTAILGEFKKRLVGVLPPECFAYSTGELVAQLPRVGGQAGNDDLPPSDALQILAFSSGQELHGARISDAGAERFAMESMLPGEPLDQALPRLMQQLCDPHEAMPVLLGGVLREEEKPLEITQGMLPEADPAGGMERLALYGAPGELDVIECPGPLSPRFMQAVGAGVLAMQGKDEHRTMLLHSHESFTSRLRANPMFLPALIVGLAVLTMAGLQLHVRMKTAYLQHSMAALKEQKADIEADVKKERDLESKQASLKRNAQEKERLKQMLSGDIAMRTVRLAQLLHGLVEDTPPEIMLTRFEQLSDDAYTLDGVGTSSAVISQYLLQLRNTSIVGDTRLVKTTPAKGQGDPKARPAAGGNTPEATLLEFSIRISLEEAK